MRRPKRVLLFIALLLVPLAAARAASVAELLDAPLKDLHGQAAGTLEDVIVDVSAGRVAYLVLQGPSRYHTVPARALDEQLRLDMSLEDRAAPSREGKNPVHRRARRLIGGPVGHGDAEPVGTLADIEFAPGTGSVEGVVVTTPQGRRTAPPSVLLGAGARPIAPPAQEVPPARDPASRGSAGPGMRPSTERTTVHDHEWDRFGRPPP